MLEAAEREVLRLKREGNRISAETDDQTEAEEKQIERLFIRADELEHRILGSPVESARGAAVIMRRLLGEEGSRRIRESAAPAFLKALAVVERQAEEGRS